MKELLHNLAARAHNVSFWTGVVGAVVLLLNQVLGLSLNTPEVVSAAGVIAAVVLGGHYVSAHAASAAGAAQKSEAAPPAAPAVK